MAAHDGGGLLTPTLASASITITTPRSQHIELGASGGSVQGGGKRECFNPPTHPHPSWPWQLPGPAGGGGGGWEAESIHLRSVLAPPIHP